MEQDGEMLNLELRCRLGAAPGLLQNLLDEVIKPLAEKYDPEGLHLHYDLVELATPTLPTDNEVGPGMP